MVMNISKAEFGSSGFNPVESAGRFGDWMKSKVDASREAKESKKAGAVNLQAHQMSLESGERMHAQNIELEKFKAVAPEYMKERSAGREGKRREAFYKMATADAQAGTAVNLKMGDYASSLTKSLPPKPAVTPTAPKALPKPKSNKPPRYYISTRSAKKGKK